MCETKKGTGLTSDHCATRTLAGNGNLVDIPAKARKCGSDELESGDHIAHGQVGVSVQHGRRGEAELE